MHAKIYMNVPYAQKEEAKALGAKWDANVKKWFYEGEVKNFPKFGKWILENEEECIIAYENLCIIEGKQTCYKCKKETRVIGLGIREHSKLRLSDEYIIDDPDDTSEVEDEIFLAWVTSETDIPPLLLRYMKKHYNVKTGFSNQVGKCFANHCEHCGSIQGNYHLFYGENSPISTMTPVESELIDRMSRLKICNIYTDAALVLNWNMGYCSNDWAYTVYCKQFEDIILSEMSEELFIEYAELYDLL